MTKFQKLFKTELDKKLQEELNEYAESGSIEELADLVEVVYGILEWHEISLKTFEDIRLNKQSKRGSFKKRLYLEYVETDLKEL